MSPIKLARPRATIAARKKSKVNADIEFERVGPYYISQANHFRDKKIEDAHKTNTVYQRGRSAVLSSPRK